MSRIIFDIETTGKDFDSLEKPVQDYLLQWAESEEEKEKVHESLSLYPLTGEIVAIGMLNPDSGKGAVYFQNTGEPIPSFDEERIRYETGSEPEILVKFWDAVKSYDQFITFNGRGFDCPFIMIRSAVRRIRPKRDLMPNRYGDIHIDIFDQLSFYGASRRKFSLDMWCRTFGIKSPKEDGIAGNQVKELFLAGRHIDIARYCAGDLRATKELLTVWENYLKYPNKQKADSKN
ncbi:MAG TPA: ribonuclease H-like domain-containing protein [Candidatus Sulfobium mesophilum]|nr:ribonuclease H-like domain-containing protein [Candidatus Sulfobium mesophilum]